MKGLTWPAVVLVAVLGGLSVALLSLTDLTSGEVLGIIGVLAGVGGGAAVANAGSGQAQAVAQQVAELREETQAQTPVLETVARRVNGELDARMAEAVDKGNADLIRLLREHGVLR